MHTDYQFTELSFPELKPTFLSELKKDYSSDKELVFHVEQPEVG